ncbi:MAG: MFS transporter, partial [Bacteroidota bacterium]
MILDQPSDFESAPNIQKNVPRVMNAWASYDWANSVYNLTITAAIFPVYYEISTKNHFGGETVLFFGREWIASVLYAYAIALSFLFAAILSPLLSGLADYGGKKKLFMQVFTYIGSAACMVLYFFDGSNVELGVIAALIASMGYSGAIVFYISYLPDIASDDRMDSLSAKGFSLGFLGSVIQLFVSLAIIFNHSALGIPDEAQATRLSFLLVGLWWIGFAQIAFFNLPSNIYNRKAEGNLFRQGFKE